MEIFDQAPDTPLRAFAFGYLAHLAADAVAHNYFVPRQLAITSSTTALGHSYWESRFETHLGERYSRRARDLLLGDHLSADAHLDRILSPTIFSTQTNRRLFRGMVYVADSESWLRIFHLVAENSRWDLPDDDVGAYVARSYDFIIDLLRRLDHSEPFALDPSGLEPLGLAKRVRRAAMRRGRHGDIERDAARHFGMPATSLAYAARTPDAPLSARARRQELIDALRIGASLRLLHNASHERSLQLPLPGEVPRRFGWVFRHHFVDPPVQRRIVSDLA